MNKKRIKTELLVHDLKNPLAVIEVGILSLIQKGEKYGTLTDKHLKVLYRTLRNSKIAKTLVNDILEVGRSSEGIIVRKKFPVSEFVKRPLVAIFDLNDIETAEKIGESTSLSEIKEILEAKGIILKIDQEMWTQELYLDGRKLRQIFRNLLSNALKYRLKKIEIEIKEEEGCFFTSVSDDGDGIDKAYHEKIFECYFQLDGEQNHCVRGHGLGLAGVLILVEDMGGRLILESDEGQGTKFSVLIPLVEDDEYLSNN